MNAVREFDYQKLSDGIAAGMNAKFGDGFSAGPKEAAPPGKSTARRLDDLERENQQLRRQLLETMKTLLQCTDAVNEQARKIDALVKVISAVADASGVSLDSLCALLGVDADAIREAAGVGRVKTQ